jgi:hypothetical protein
MNLGDIFQPVTGWVQQTKTLQPGEVIFIQGLTKGISSKKQVFLFDGSVAYDGANHHLYMSADISINYYKNFRYYQSSLHVTSDPVNDIDIANAFNIKFDDLGINVITTYDASTLSFTGTQAGYSYNITNIDVSLWEPAQPVYDNVITEDLSSGIPAFKYSNSAMLGYVLKVTYPSDTETVNSYIDLNHVPDYLEYFVQSDSSCYTRYYKAVDVGQSGASCDPDTLSAADYLDYVQTNGKWEKVGVLKIWLGVSDSGNNENLITGFYLFNSQIFPVTVSYMIIL